MSGTALIIEGGGTRNSYLAPMVELLIDARQDFGMVAGISAGSSLAVAYLSRDAERAKASFIDMVVDPRAGGFGSWLRGQGYFNSRFIYEESTKGPYPFNFEAFRQHPSAMDISAMRADTGETVHWGKQDCPTVDDLVVRVRASSTMPLFMPITYIDGAPYVDGALGASGGLALDAAKEAGYERFVVLRSRPRGFRRKPSSAGRVLRRYPAVARAIGTRHERYNATADEIDALEQSGAAYVYYPERMLIGNSERKLAKLQANYEAGAEQAKREIDALLGWM
ncbi:patatin-like phospholipase family protein [Corynebacterium kozikiae]|uniref:patatin-like phospholipase family protein n=1 Tax=Corynebacterium kozikiae TaxID=2968469 RepID=UPI00211B9F54|nr:patatin-like phospholipase family protein [Corynebacterium sp. 76QC2CO]MCQ9343315.1 patatin-like phospholipase family protein [Corynebacterium sp. 76QC2CO]